MGALTRYGVAARLPNVTFMAKVREQPDGCWKWYGSLSHSPNGDYGTVSVNGRTRAAHRRAWELFRGPIPDGLQIDHLCRNTRCVNPLHLEPVTARENILRGRAPAALNARKTRCIRGHEFTPENTIRYQNHRACRTCVNEAQARNRRRRLSEAS